MAFDKSKTSINVSFFHIFFQTKPYLGPQIPSCTWRELWDAKASSLTSSKHPKSVYCKYNPVTDWKENIQEGRAPSTNGSELHSCQCCHRNGEGHISNICHRPIIIIACYYYRPNIFVVWAPFVHIVPTVVHCCRHLWSSHLMDFGPAEWHGNDTNRRTNQSGCDVALT
jgi:hypothetical protein